MTHRSCVPILSLLALAVCGSAQAIDPTLQVVSGPSSAETRRPVPLTSARFEPTSRTLVATTRAGNFTCNTSQVPNPSALKLRLDGVEYPITTSALPGLLVAPIEYLPTTVTFALGLLGTSLPGSCASSNTTSTNLGLIFETQRRLPVAESVFFDITTRSFQIRVAEPVLCTSYVALGSGSGLRIALNSSNEPLFNASTATSLPGFATINYALGTFNLVPVAQGGAAAPGVQCSVPNSVVTLTPGGGGGGNSIFSSGFEPASTSGNPSDVTVSISGIGSGTAGNNQRGTGALPGGSLQYLVRVQNTGAVSAANVQMREFATGPQAIAQPGQPQPVQMLAGESGSSTCVRIGGGACPAFGFPISLSLGTIAPGEGFEFTLTRVVSASATPGQLGQLGYAAFVDPAGGGPDANLSNNGAWLAASIISNQQPVIAAIGNQGMTEDGTPLALAVTVTDPEGDPLQTPTVTSNNATLFPPGSLVITGSTSPWTLTITPAANQNGSANVQVSATDGNSAPRTLTFQVSVTAVNDPPTFNLNVAGGELIMTGGVGGCVPPICTASALNFITQRLPGPATAVDEATQVVRPNTEKDGLGDARLIAGACVPAAVDGVDPTLFFTGGLLPRVNEPGGAGSFNLVASLAGVAGAVDCAITVIDDGSPAAVSLPQTLRIRYQAPPP
ncbi:MAG: Ig-like domain-containing protein [Pseudomarimonas sp.]